MNDFRPWLRPTLIGPFAVVWGLTTLGHVSVGLATITGDRIDSWLVGMLLGGFFAAAVVVGLIASDVALLGAKLRRLPTGALAWASSCIAPVAILMLWSVLGWGDGDSVLELVVRIAWPFAAAPLALRYALGTSPS